MLTEPDVLALIELLGAVAALPVGLAEKKRRLLGEVCQMIGGDAWRWTLRGKTKAIGGSADLDRIEGGDATVLPLVTTSLGEKSRGKRNNGTVALSFCQLAEETVSTIVFGRKSGSEPFSARDEELVHIICEEIPWLHERIAPVTKPPEKFELSPRQRATLNLLLRGLSERAISKEMRISPHTVRGYTKELYRHFGIHSRAVLMNRLSLRGK